MEKSQILEFMSARQLMTVSSINSVGKPQAAVVGFGQNDQFQLIFGTSSKSRKYANIVANPNVAVVIGWDGPQTVQYEGVARVLEGAEATKLAEHYYANNPVASKNGQQADERIILVEPRWLRLTDLRHKPWAITEIKF